MAVWPLDSGSWTMKSMDIDDHGKALSKSGRMLSQYQHCSHFHANCLTFMLSSIHTFCSSPPMTSLARRSFRMYASSLFIINLKLCSSYDHFCKLNSTFSRVSRSFSLFFLSFQLSLLSTTLSLQHHSTSLYSQFSYSI